jgi:hypothetical protein
MKQVMNVSVACILLLAGANGMAAPEAAGHRDPTAAMHGASDEAWPTTRVGTLARGWVEAFCAGDSAMRSFYRSGMSEASLTQRGVDVRVLKYHELHEHFGNLTLLRVVEASALELKVSLMAGDASQQVFIFKIEKDAPQKLLSVGYMQTRTHGGGMFHP